MANECEKISPNGSEAKIKRETKIDESYFLLRNLLGVAKRVRGKRGPVAGGKTPVFSNAALRWHAKADAKVHTQVVSNCQTKTLLPI